PSELRPYHVLVTGFGPFSRYAVNPSWLAVKALHNTILEVEVSIESISPSAQPRPIDSDACLVVTREVHITALQVPVTYDAVLSTIPGLHTRPPVLPPSSDPSLPLPSPPPDGYDLFFHVGVSDSPLLQLERVAHKFGYDKKDAAGCLAPLDSLESPVDGNETSKRGFGKGYESFAEELYTEMDVEGLVHHLKKCGVEYINTSMDAGHYLCEFIYYCSLAESKRSSTKNQVIFLHCPPVDLPLSTDE
ncbi:hypothetical protein SCLCIDRAFT_86792, partial [Scleroderma citrinum Foug A]